MKKLTLFLAASLLGLSSLASAAPSHQSPRGGSVHVSVDHSNDSLIVRDHRAPSHRSPAEQEEPSRAHQTPAFDRAGNRREIKRVNRRDAAQIAMPGWSKLGAISTGTQYFQLDGATKYRSFAFSADTAVSIDKVIVRYADGTQDNFRLDAQLGTDRRAPSIDLAGNKKVKAVVVVSDATAAGDVTLFAK